MTNASLSQVFVGLLSGLLAILVVEFGSPGASFAQQSTKPIVLPVVKSSSADDGDALYLSVIKVGSANVDVPLLLDTGSASISIDCKEILPAATCTENGIDSKAVQGTGIQLTGFITESNFEKTVEHRQMAYATLSIGNKDSYIATETAVPFFIRFKETDRATGKLVTTRHKGVFGISPIDATAQKQGELSALRAINPGRGLRRGYILHAVGGDFRNCSKNFLKCEQRPVLQIGLGPDDNKRFLMSKVNRLAPRWPFATVEACLTFGKSEICKPTLFDTGSAKSIIASKSSNASNQLSMKQDVTVKGSAFETFSFKPSKSQPVKFIPELPFNVVGITYFVDRSFLVDFEGDEVGFGRAVDRP